MGKRTGKIKEKRNPVKRSLCQVIAVILLSVFLVTKVSGEAEEYGDWNYGWSAENTEDELSVNQDSNQKDDSQEFWNRDNAIYGVGGSSEADFSSGEGLSDSASHQTGGYDNSDRRNNVGNYSQQYSQNQQITQNQEETDSQPITEPPEQQKKTDESEEVSVIPPETSFSKKSKKTSNTKEKNKKKAEITQSASIFPSVKNKTERQKKENIIPEMGLVYRKIDTDQCKKAEIKLNTLAVAAVVSIRVDDRDIVWRQEGNRIQLIFSENGYHQTEIALLCREDFTWTERQKNAILSYNTF